MALHSKQFCELTGLQHDKAANTFYGTLQGYPVYLLFLPRKNTVIFRLSAKTPADDNAPALQPLANEWCTTHSGVSAISFKNRCLSAAVSLTPKNTEENLSAVTAALVAFAASQSLIPCCMSCGAESGYRMYLLDDSGVTVCDPCKPYVEQNIQQAADDAAAVRANPVGHIIGAVIGAAVVFFLTFIVLKASYLSVLTSFAGVLLGLYLMRKFGKKLTVPALVFCTVLCLIAGFAAPVLHFSEVIADFNTENAAQAQQVCDAYQSLEELIVSIPADEPLPEELGDIGKYKEMNEQARCILNHTDSQSCLKDMPELLKMDTYSDLKPELIKCLIITLISILACIVLFSVPMLKADQGVHTLRELSA